MDRLNSKLNRENTRKNLKTKLILGVCECRFGLENLFVDLEFDDFTEGGNFRHADAMERKNSASSSYSACLVAQPFLK